ncbi:MAG: hypothetical protein IJ654_06720 [Bacteroidales bacterium]|nr:hypothetical protein [Bacteroidales bacterium]
MPQYEDLRLRNAGAYQDTDIYELSSQQFTNRYHILSHSDSRALMAYPEVVGFVAYQALLAPTAAGLQYLQDRGLGRNLDILTILRGGLNYPLEEACSRCREPFWVSDIHFLSCERKIETRLVDGITERVITGLEIKYEKIRPGRDRILAIGDILATGDTFRFCLDHFLEAFRSAGGSLRRLVFFTVGGMRALPLMEAYAERMRGWWPDFEGVDVFFFEGMFTIYGDKGVSGINTPDIDFGWLGGVVSPDFRRYVVERPPYVLLEKCIIYDGGARRYEIPVHFEEVLEYWEGILARADRIDPAALVAEKLGHAGGLDYSQWLEATHLQEITFADLEGLWRKEMRLIEEACSWDLGDIARRKIASVKSIQSLYEK